MVFLPSRARAPILAVGALVLFSLLSHQRARLAALRGRRLSAPDAPYRIARAALLPLSLRFREAAADLLWVRALLYFGVHSEGGRAPRFLAAHFDDVFALDPYLGGYQTAAFLALQGAGSAAETTRAAVAYLEEGARRFPDDWFYPFYLASLHLGRGSAPTPAARRENRRIAAEWIERAVILGAGRGAPDWLPALAATLYTDLGQRELAYRQLEAAMLAVPDEAARAKIKAKLISLRGRVEAERAQQAVAEFRARHARSFPYVPLDLFALLGDRAPARVPRLADLAAGPQRDMLAASAEEPHAAE